MKADRTGLDRGTKNDQEQKLGYSAFLVVKAKVSSTSYGTPKWRALRPTDGTSAHGFRLVFLYNTCGFYVPTHSKRSPNPHASQTSCNVVKRLHRPQKEKGTCEDKALVNQVPRDRVGHG